jgi:CubicO group peptidase (beta-lactamase class C family)
MPIHSRLRWPALRAVLLLATLLVLVSLAHADDTPSAAPVAPPSATSAPVLPSAADLPAPGAYRGQLTLPGGAGELELVLHVGPDESGSWTALLDVPAQHASQLPLREVTVTPERVAWTLDSPAGTATFEGKYDPASHAISGIFKQGGMELPLRLAFDDTALRLAAVQAKLADYPAHVNQWLQDWQVPGCSIGVIYQGQIVLAQGFGVRNLDSKTPVSADTLFPIGSATKAFTTLLLGQLADDGKLDWDHPVRDYLPDFKLYNDDLTDHVTVRDLVTHRTGLPRHDGVWYGSPFNREELFHHLRYLAPSEPLRTQFQYNNLMFMTAGYLAGQLRGASWEDLVQQRILTPLGMSSTTLTTPACCGAPDHADGYWQLPDDKGVPGPPTFIALSDFQALAPAGSISSSAHDMLKWVEFQLGDGQWHGQPVVSPGQLTQMHSLQMAIGSSLDNPRSPLQGYGMGWFVSDYRGHYCVDHGGNIDGFTAMVRLFPQDQLGIVVLSNLANTPLPSIAAYGAADRLLDLSENDISGRALAQRKQAQAAAAAGAHAAPHLPTGKEPGAQPAHPLADYAGSYTNSGYGEVQIATGPNGTLSCTFNGFKVALGHTQFETFKVTDRHPLLADTQLLFITDISGHVSGLSVQLEPAVDPIVFSHQIPSPASDPAFAQAVQGAYKVGDTTLTLSVRNGTLFALVPGQPEYELVPVGGNEFNLKGLAGYSLRLELDSSGKLAHAYMVQPDGTYEAVKQ